MQIAVSTAFVFVAILGQSVFAVDLSPAKWLATARERAEKRDIAGWTPTAARSISGKNGVISATASPIAVQAGLEALRQGGTAADAAATAALTQITTQLGSVVSYAGIMTLVYYDVKTGKVYLDDIARYRVIWSEPPTSTHLGHRVYTAGLPGLSAYNHFPALNLAEELKLNQRQPFWKDPAALAQLQQINDVVTGAPDLDPKLAAFLRAKGVDISSSAQLTKSFARALVPLLEQLYTEPRNIPRHSNAVVVFDKEGNVAAITHTINSVIWGDTGIVVGGIPNPDSAGFQQARLSAIKPGDRVPNEMMQTIVFKGETPMLATAAVGSLMILETLKLVLRGAKTTWLAQVAGEWTPAGLSGR